MSGFALKDSGKRREFPTGSVRDVREGKGRYDLLPSDAIRRVAIIFEKGAKKYGENNWLRGQPLMSYLDSALRHIFQHKEGLRDEDHVAQAAWNLLAFLETEVLIERELLPKELDDRPNYTVKTESANP